MPKHIKPTVKPTVKPTIAELEAILAEPGLQAVIEPDGRAYAIMNKDLPWIQEMQNKITRLEHQLHDMEQQRDEAGRRYIAQVQECIEKDRRINELENAFVHSEGNATEFKARIAELEKELATANVEHAATLKADVEQLKVVWDDNFHLRSCLKRLENAIASVLGRADAWVDQCCGHAGKQCANYGCPSIAELVKPLREALKERSDETHT